jgi:hypothetical protein
VALASSSWPIVSNQFEVSAQEFYFCGALWVDPPGMIWSRYAPIEICAILRHLYPHARPTGGVFGGIALCYPRLLRKRRSGRSNRFLGQLSLKPDHFCTPS